MSGRDPEVFFRVFDGIDLQQLVDQGEATFTVEDLYQAIKTRLTRELRVHVRPHCVFGRLEDLKPQKTEIDGSSDDIGGP